MAERRMFAKTIIDSDAFLSMPMSTQALYFHLAMRADDDGFVNAPRKIARMLGAADDDMKILIGKRYILAFASGVIVIKHWRIHNYLQSDRYKPTLYQEEKATLVLKGNKSYTEAARLPMPDDDPEPLEIPDDIQDGNDLDTKCIQNVYNVDTQDRLGKDRLELGENSIEDDGAEAPTPSPVPDKVVQHKYGEYNNVLLTDFDLEKLKNEFPDWEQRIARLSEYIASKGARYKNHLATIRSWARREKEKKNGQLGSRVQGSDRAGSGTSGNRFAKLGDPI